MADQKLSQKSTLTKSTIATNDLVYVADVSASATKGITYQELIQPLDTQFAIADNSDTTKKIAFQASGITTGTTRTLTAPDADTTIVGTDTTQTLTNKTLTSPQINMSSNATGDMYYRNSGGTTVRLPIGSSGQILNADATGIPAWIANPSASDATTAVKGVVELGTQAENDAGTGTPTTTASLIPTIGTIRARLLNTGVVDTGTSTAYAIAPTPAITAYATYQEFTAKCVNANTTGTPTINVNAVGAKTITNPDGSALAIGQIAANSIQKFVYDGTNMQLISLATKRVANGVTTRAGQAASSAQTIAHGLGKTPTIVRISTKYSNTGNGFTPHGHSNGVYSNAAQSCVYSYGISGAGGTASEAGNSATQIIKIAATLNGSAIAQAAILTVDATNLTLTWTATGGGLDSNGNINICWEAE